MITDESQRVVWRWENTEPFGKSLPEEDPDGDGIAFEMPLRFPGQYRDAETGLFYNYFRDYDPQTGRYVQSDPIGVLGGLNTYAYVAGNPLGAVDPLGLVRWTGRMNTVSADLGGGAARMTFSLVSECVNGERYRVEVLAGGFSVGFGLNFSATTGLVEFEDDNSAVDPFVFEGRALFVGGGVTIGGYDPRYQRYPWQKRGPTFSCQAIELGGARSLGCGPNVGLEFSISGGAGISIVRDVQKECCNASSK
ncbi:MAG: RHS repeat-associated core domain-containing protein [Burkholderiales bacterium]